MGLGKALVDKYVQRGPVNSSGTKQIVSLGCGTFIIIRKVFPRTRDECELRSRRAG